MPDYAFIRVVQTIVLLAAVILIVSTVPIAAQTDEIAALSDDFSDSSTLARWKRHDAVEGWPSQIAVVNINQSIAGELYVEPYTSVWFAGFRAPFLFKDVSGDFVVTTRVFAQGKTKDFPDEEGSLAGLMVRAPRSGNAENWKSEEENYISLTAGLASGPGGRGPALETTVTTRGQSPLEWRTGRQGWVWLRIARIGPNFILMHRFEGGQWVFHHLDARVLGRAFGMRAGIVEAPGLPALLQVGITAMTDWNTIREKWGGLSGSEEAFRKFNSTVVKPPDGKPDLRARFDVVAFRRVVIPAQLQGRRLSDLTAPELLSFLGD